MKPETNKTKSIRKATLAYSWAKEMIKMLRNKRVKNFRNNQNIHNT